MSQHRQHCFRAFCVIANLWKLISSPDHLMSGTTDVMQRVLSHHLSSVPYQFSIIEDVGVDSPVTTQFWRLSLDLKQCDPWRNGLTRLKCLITGQGQYFHGFCFCSQHAQRCSSFILNFSVCFKLYTQPTTSFNACYTDHIGLLGCCNNFHFHYRCDLSRA